MSTTLSDDELQLLRYEYSPSMHTRRYSTPEEAIQGHIEFIERETSRIRSKEDLEIEYNVRYGETEDEVLDIYQEKFTGGDAPIFIFIHGGYWQMLTKDTSAYFVEPLTKAGYRVLVVNYSLCPKVTLETLVKQIQRCIKFCMSHIAINTSFHISLCGHSAGAHLILAALSDKVFWNTLADNIRQKLKYLYLVSGVYDLKIIRYVPTINDDNILGITDNNVYVLSPYRNTFNHVKDMKINFFVGEYESGAFKKHSIAMYQKLKCIEKENGLSIRMEVVEGVDHFDIVENLSQSDFTLTKHVIKEKP